MGIVLSQLSGPINAKPHPTQYGNGWAITRGFDAKFCPEGGAFEFHVGSQIPYHSYLSMWGI